MSVLGRQKELRKLIEQYEAELVEIEKLLRVFPDLDVGYDRWENRYYTAGSANNKAESAWFNHNCGCCADSPLQMWPYVEVNGFKVHSNPKYFTVGESCSNCGRDIPDDGWEVGLRNAGIPETVIQVGVDYFIENSCECWGDEDQ